VQARRSAAAVAMLLVLVLLAGCVANVTGPARTAGTYRHKAAATAAAAASNVATAALLAEAGSEGRAMFPYLSVVISEAEDGLGAARTTFDAIQPPTVESELVRDELGALLDVAADDLTEARIAIRRGDATDLADLAQRLRGDVVSLQAFEERNR
jgi:hypothetical protein